jgi:hypothetical protein
VKSELALKPEQEWEQRKERVGGAIDMMVRVTEEQLSRIIPDLEAIRDKRLYRHGDYKTFESFCEKVVGVTYRRVNQMIREHAVIGILGNNFPKLTGRAVAELKDIEPAAAVQIVEQAQASHPKRRVTAAGIKRVRQARVIDAATGEPEEEHRCPCCGQPVKRDAVLVPWPAVSA